MAIQMLSPKIQLFNAIFKLSQKLGYDTYDYLPGANAPYPFVHVSESNESERINNKEVIFGNVSQTVHVWGYANNKALFEEMSWNIQQSLRRLKVLENYHVRFISLTSNEIVDNTTTDNLLHGIIGAEFEIY